MIGIIAGLAGIGLVMWALKGKALAPGQQGPGVFTSAPIQLPGGSTPAVLPGKGATTTLQAPSSKTQYFVTSWPQDTSGRQFAVAQAINDPQGVWVSFYVNPSTKARSLFASNPAPNDQAKRDFAFIA